MYRIIAFAITLLLFLSGPASLAECSGETSGVVWKASRIGKLSADMQIGPNGLLYLTCGNKLVALQDNGGKLWEAPIPAGGAGIFDRRGSIFFPGSASVQEMKVNGGSGWNFTVYTQDKSKSVPMLTEGPDSLLYLPLPAALYALDRQGNYKWRLEWDNSGQEILACAGNSQAVFVVRGDKKKGFNLDAVNGGGEILWSYWLGYIKSAGLALAADNRLYVAANPARVDRLNRGMVYSFAVKEGAPDWKYSVNFNDLTAPTPTQHGMLYFCAGEKLFALNQSDGTEYWQQILIKAISRPVADEVNRLVYVGADDSRLLVVNLQGRLEKEITLDGKVSTQPLVDPSGYLYAATDKGSLYKIKYETTAAPEVNLHI